MFGEKDRNRRLAKEAKALQRKAQRHGGELSGKEAARYTKVRGSLVKYSIRDEGEDCDDWDN